MIKTFANRHTRDLYQTGHSERFPPHIRRRALRRLEYVDLAICLEDLRVPPSSRLRKLEADRKGRYCISVDDRWRICFRFTAGDARDVELTDS